MNHFKSLTFSSTCKHYPNQLTHHDPTLNGHPASPVISLAQSPPACAQMTVIEGSEVRLSMPHPQVLHQQSGGPMYYISPQNGYPGQVSQILPQSTYLAKPSLTSIQPREELYPWAKSHSNLQSTNISHNDNQMELLKRIPNNPPPNPMSISCLVGDQVIWTIIFLNLFIIFYLWISCFHRSWKVC